MRSGSLFAGVAGLDQAVTELFDAEPTWFVENDPAASRVLTHRYPDVPNYGDITTINWDQVKSVDILTAGFPCQDISNAGRRAGIEGARSGLWTYVADAIRVLRPRYVVLENVSALVVRGLDRVLADLAALGCDVVWTCVRASDIGAPHRRERWFAVVAAATDADCSGLEGRQPAQGRDLPAGSAVTDTAGARRPQPVTLATVDNPGAGASVAGQVEPGGLDRVAADSDGHGLAIVQRIEPSVGSQPDVDGRGQTDWGVYAPAIRRWEHVIGRPAPVPTVRGARGGRKLNPALPEWMMGFPAGWITDVPGVSINDALRLAGNAVCQQQAAAALRWLLPLIDTEVAA